MKIINDDRKRRCFFIIFRQTSLFHFHRGLGCLAACALFFFFFFVNLPPSLSLLCESSSSLGSSSLSLLFCLFFAAHCSIGFLAIPTIPQRREREIFFSLALSARR